MLVAYRYDAHKLTGHGHDCAPETFETILVNQEDSHGADADATALSRPSGQPDQTVPAHQSRSRLSLFDGTSSEENTSEDSGSEAIRQLLVLEGPEQLHKQWLTSAIASQFCESVYHPYTSLKYHTLLAAALLGNYRSGNELADLSLVVDPADSLVQDRTI